MSELQTAITNLQLKHGELVAAVKSYPGTVASAANAAFGKASVEQRKARDTVRNLRKRIENAGQSLILDWEYDVAVVNGEGRNLSEVVTFSRSTGGGRFGPDGKYEWVGPDVPRIDYDPVTGECLGLLVEEQRTNLITNSESSSAVGVVLNNTTLEPSGITSPSGIGNFLYLRENTADSYHQLGFEVPPTLPETDYTFSLYIHKMSVGSRTFSIFPFNSSKVGGTASRGVMFSPAGEFLGYIGAGTNPGYYIQVFADYYRVCVTGKTGAGGIGVPTVRLGELTYKGDGNSGLYYWGAQFEQGSFPTSYIPTEGRAVTRTADAASRALGGEFNQTEGTLFAEGSTFDKDRAGGTEPTIAYLGERYSADAMDFRFTVGEDRIILRAASIFSVTRPYSGKYKGAATYNPHEMTGVIGGGVVERTAAVGRISSSDLIIGNSAVERHLNGHVKRLEYYPRALSDTELQELTSL